jgi:hypothetical protein
MELHEMIEKIKTKEELADFVEKLRMSLNVAPVEWENPSLERFLEAMEAWIREIDRCAKNMSDKDISNPSWSTFAKILYAAKVYE